MPQIDKVRLEKKREKEVCEGKDEMNRSEQIESFVVEINQEILTMKLISYSYYIINLLFLLLPVFLKNHILFFNIVLT